MEAKTLKKENTLVIENILKENLSTDVHIDSAFMEAFRSELNIKAISKLSTTENMNGKVGFGFFSNLFKNKFLKYGFLSVIALLVLGVTYVAFSGSKGVIKTVTNTDPKLVAQLYVSSGKVNVFRNGDQLTFEVDSELQVGDRISVPDNTIADISTYYGRLALDSNSEVLLGEKDGNMMASVNNGNVFVSLSKGFSNIIVGTPNAEILLGEGSIFVSQNGYTSSLSRGGLLSSVFAEEGNGSTNIACFSGKSTVTVGSTQYPIEAGKEILIAKDKTVSAPAEITKEKVSPVLAQVVTNNPGSGDIGYMADMTAPEVTLLSPVEGATVESSTIEVRFKSNEAGYYNFGAGWTALLADQEVVFTKALVVGANKIEFTVKDASYNMKSVTVNVVAQFAQVAVSWIQVPQALTSGVYMKWGVTGAKVGQTYKVFRNGSFYSAFTVRDETLTSAYWTDAATVKGQTYTYVVALYEGGGELAKNEVMTVVADTTAVASDKCSLSLAKGAGSTMSWSVNGVCDPGSGFKLVWSSDSSPVYPGSEYNYYSETSTRSGTVDGAGSLRVRVCIYHPELDSKCTNYSNEIISTF